jgi:hypothetical protein
MNPLFTINFRRESSLREVARARRRVVVLGLWVSYFGVLAVVVGLYGLNCVSLEQRAGLIARQTARLRAAQGTHRDWTVGRTELAQVEQFAASPRRWRDRLTRIAALLPPGARLTLLAFNPDQASAPADQKLVLSGELRVAPGQDRMQGVMQLVTALHRDSVLAAGYRNIRLASTQISEGTATSAQFVIECRP